MAVHPIIAPEATLGALVAQDVNDGATDLEGQLTRFADTPKLRREVRGEALERCEAAPRIAWLPASIAGAIPVPLRALPGF